jgi:peroxiredoxin
MPRFLFTLCGIAAVATTFVPSFSTAGEFNPDINIGDEAPAWLDLPGTDEKRHSLADLSDKKAVVVVFTCNSCPYAVDAEERLVALADHCVDLGVAVVAINVKKTAEESMELMKERAKQRSFPFAYLLDESQKIAKDFGARYTPECFVLNQQRKITYMGSLDDSPDGKKVTKQYVRDALAATLAGKTPDLQETVPIGCRIRFDRKRRTRRAATK